jgi:superfamily II DNA helicase RecQ
MLTKICMVTRIYNTIQTGRAGRDGAPSQCVLFYAPAEFSMLGAHVAKNWANFGETQRTERTRITAQMAAYTWATSMFCFLFLFIRSSQHGM